MEQFIKRLSALPFAIALFDDNDGDGGGNDGDGNGTGANGNDGGNAGGQQRNGRGQFSRHDGNGDRSNDADRSNRVYATDINEANRRIAELNDESAARRRENRDLKKELQTVQSRQSLVDQRAIRMEAREALRASGVIDPDVVDLFLKHAGQGITIDEQTGDVVGVESALGKFKEAKPVFFKVADGDGENAGGSGQGNGAGNGASSGNGGGSSNGAGAGANASGQGGDADARGNATGTGASVAGGAGTGGDGGFKVANFRDPNVDPKEAMRRYKASLR